MDDVLAVVVGLLVAGLVAGEATRDDPSTRTILSCSLLFDADLHLVVDVIIPFTILIPLFQLQRLVLELIGRSSTFAHERYASFGPHDVHLIVFVMKNFASLTSSLLMIGTSAYLEALDLQQRSPNSLATPALVVAGPPPP